MKVEHGKIVSPYREAWDDLIATGTSEQGQETMSIPLGDVAGKRTSFTLVGDLHCVQSQCLGLVFNWTKPVEEERSIQIESTHVWSRPTVLVFPLLARLVAVGLVWNAWKIFIPTQTRHHLISLPHTTLEVPSHCHHLERCNMSSHGPHHYYLLPIKTMKASLCPNKGVPTIPLCFFKSFT